ncbi:hypothetical protein ETB97_010044 [Aspergillus alliaceus]|uniref:Uncharacterized protein n=1 Tax=Petromyces alliaceus TaxID=209559 RepID=A0A8H6E0S3_PETAA|nr:hypothetical protein ETB97_010044 [Aspergillus burnettii]
MKLLLLFMKIILASTCMDKSDANSPTSCNDYLENPKSCISQASPSFDTLKASPANPPAVGFQVHQPNKESKLNDLALEKDQRVLNRVIRAYYNSDLAQTLSPARPTPTNSDHFIEIQVVVRILMDESEIKHIPLGQLVRLSEYINSRKNLYRIEAKLNNEKSRIPLDWYPNDAEIFDYYNSRLPNTSYTVLDMVKQLLKEMMEDSTIFSPLSRRIGSKLYEKVCDFPIR